MNITRKQACLVIDTDRRQKPRSFCVPRCIFPSAINVYIFVHVCARVCVPSRHLWASFGPVKITELSDFSHLISLIFPGDIANCPPEPEKKKGRESCDWLKTLPHLCVSSCLWMHFPLGSGSENQTHQVLNEEGIAI